MRKILYISGTRADYGLMESTLSKIDQHPNLNLEIVATGMHVMKEFGYTLKQIKKSFTVHSINAIYEKDDKESMAKFLGEFILKLIVKIRDIKPDIILLLGDRAEMLGGAIVGNYLTIPVAHIHGGEITSTVDEVSRHAITKLSHLHFVATRKSATRIVKMGEDFWRVFEVGAPALDTILNKKLISKEKIAKKYNLDLFKPILLVLQHPVTTEIDLAKEHIGETMEAIKELGLQTIVIYPNADAGGRKMIKVIEKYKKYPFIKIYKSLSHLDYLSLMRITDAMVGNSSSGIIEAPSFHLPAVNIGSRQEGRERADNIIDVGYNRKEIKAAISKALYDSKFRAKLKKCKNPYGNGKTGLRVADILSKIKINKRLLKKQITY